MFEYKQKVPIYRAEGEKYACFNWIGTTTTGFENRGLRNSMKNNLVNVRRTLHDLLRALPAVRSQCSQEVLKKHLALIEFYQRRYDQLVLAS